tara:strand:- start:804 stop:1034 length:231 start_codon:yes stop_codon:yes gene_type:complete
MKPVIFATDSSGNVRRVDIRFDSKSETYIGQIFSRFSEKVGSGKYKLKLLATGVAASPEDAAENAIACLNAGEVSA